MSKIPQIILLDIETSPLTGYSWQTFDTSIIKVIEPSKIISVAWKVLGEEKTHCKTIADYPNYKPGIVNDEKLIKDVWKVLDSADVIITQNGLSFDHKKLNARFIVYKLPPPSFYATIDTLKVAKKYFKFDSNSLNNIGEYLGEGKKQKTGGFELWTGCMLGDTKSWERMKQYNIGDVELLERIYLRMRAWIEGHPNLNIISDSTLVACPSCQSEKLTKRGYSITKTTRRQRYQCNECASWCSGPYERSKTPLN